MKLYENDPILELSAPHHKEHFHRIKNEIYVYTEVVDTKLVELIDLMERILKDKDILSLSATKCLITELRSTIPYTYTIDENEYEDSNNDAYMRLIYMRSLVVTIAMSYVTLLSQCQSNDWSVSIDWKKFHHTRDTLIGIFVDCMTYTMVPDEIRRMYYFNATQMCTILDKNKENGLMKLYFSICALQTEPCKMRKLFLEEEKNNFSKCFFAFTDQTYCENKCICENGFHLRYVSEISNIEFTWMDLLRINALFKNHHKKQDFLFFTFASKLEHKMQVGFYDMTNNFRYLVDFVPQLYVEYIVLFKHVVSEKAIRVDIKFEDKQLVSKTFEIQASFKKKNKFAIYMQSIENTIVQTY